MKLTVLDGLCTWSLYQPERRLDFNAFWWQRPDGGVLIDPLPLTADRADLVESGGGVTTILVTNADHWRATTETKQRFGATVFAPANERERLGERAQHVDRFYEHGGDLPVELREDVDVHWIHGGKTALEAAFYLVPLRSLLFGDVVRSHRVGRLDLLPDDQIADRQQVVRDLLAMRDKKPVAVLLGDGDSLFAGAGTAWLDFLREIGS